MAKAIISNRIYLEVTPEERQEIQRALTYKIQKSRGSTRSKIIQYEIIKNYTSISSTVLSIPRGRMDLIPEGHEITDKSIEHDVPFPDPLIPLREDQLHVVNVASGRSILNAQPGWGKTFAALHLARKLGQKTLIITHTTALKDQWIEEVEKLFGMKAGVITANVFDIDHAVVVGNVQSVTKVISQIQKEFGTLILDEMHHVTANTFSAIVDSSYAKYRIGLSATLVRTDGKHILFKDYFGVEMHQPALANVLAPDVLVMKTGRMLLPGATWAEKVNDLLYDKDYQKFVADVAKYQISVGHKVLIVADRVEFLQNIGELIGEDCVCIVGGKNTPDEYQKRKALIAKILSGEKKALSGSRQIFSEGISVNPLSCLIFASPTANAGILEQVIGRIQRMYPDKLTPLVVDLALSGHDGRKQLRARLEFYQQKGWNVHGI